MYTKKIVSERLGAGLCAECGREPLLSKYYCAVCHEKSKIRRVTWTQTVKDEAFAAYGGYICVCCGETEKKFLALDHINGGGSKERRENPKGSGSTYSAMKSAGYPPLYQVLCMNCNWGKYVNNGTCPHKEFNVRPLWYDIDMVDDPPN